MLIITYFGNQWYWENLGKAGIDYSHIFWDFNKAVPFWDWTIYPYILAYVFWGATFFYVSFRSRKNMNILLTVLIVNFIICGLWYFFFQSDVQAWRETSGLFTLTNPDFTQRLVLWVYNHAGPRNALPSMHVLMSWVCILGIRLDRGMPRYSKVIIYFMASAIIISTQTLKQHYIIDLIVAIALAEGTYWIFRKNKFTDLVGKFFFNINEKFHLN